MDNEFIKNITEEGDNMLDEKVKAGQIDDYVTPTFYAPNVSWLVQRNGMNSRHSLVSYDCVQQFS